MADDDAAGPEADASLPRVMDLLDREGLIEGEPPVSDDGRVGDLTREPLTFPAGRDVRLQNLARGDEGFLLAMGYATQRGYGRNHPFAGEIRQGEVAVSLAPEELGFAVEIATITVTECQMVNQFKGSATAPAAVHARLRARLRGRGAQGDGDGPGGPRPARAASSARSRPRRPRTRSSC